MTDYHVLRISHKTTYQYEDPVDYALQQLRLTPKTRPGQKVLNWNTKLIGAKPELGFEDAHANYVQLISFIPGSRTISLECSGEVEVRNMNGIFGDHLGFMPLWMFERATALTKPGPLVHDLVQGLSHDDTDLGKLHSLSAAILDKVAYRPVSSSVTSSSEDILEAGQGVCQDHAHVFVTAARAMGFPARYVSGYLLMEDRVDQDATHAWAEAHVAALGWVGFDVSNAICPDIRYVRIATGLDYAGAAPVSGMRFGDGAENLSVAVQVEAQQRSQSQS